MRAVIIVLMCVIASVISAQPNPQSKALTKKFFADPPVEMATPAFLKTKGFTTYNEMLGFITKLQTNYPAIVTVSFIGESQNGIKIPLVRIENKNGQQSKVKVWFQGAIHGDEPASTEAMLFLIQKLVADKQYAYLLDKLVLQIVPMANIDGSAKLERVSANGLDLNRDQTKLMAPESKYLKQAFSDFGAEVAVDFHEYMPFRRDYQQFGDFGVTPPYDVMLMYSGNLNVQSDLRTYTKSRFVANCIKLLDENKLTHHDYFSTDKVSGSIHIRQGALSARSSATSYALTNAVAGLIEIRGGGLGRTSFKRRVFTGFTVASAYLKTAYDYADELKSKIAFAKANPNASVIVTSITPASKQSLNLIDLATNNLKGYDVELYDAWLTKPELVRTRPKAYILLPTQQVLVDKLKILGLRIDVLQQTKVLEVEGFVIVSYKKDTELTEAVHRQNVRAITNLKMHTFPAGSFVVNLNQPKANLAIEVLEPEAPNSFVSFAVMQTELNQELPVYRYLSTTIL